MIETVITSSLLIIVVLVLRTVFKGRISSRARYALWLIAAIRLAMPFSLAESSVSVMNYIDGRYGETSENTAAEEILQEKNPYNGGLPDHEYDMSDKIMPVGGAVTDVQHTLPEGAPDGNVQKLSAEQVIKIVWLSVTGLMLLWFVSVNILFYIRLRRGRTRLEYDFPLKIYTVKGLKSPCIFGFAPPSVYLSEEAAADKKSLGFIAVHEYCHYRCGDMFWTVLRYVLLAIYWFDPLVWAAAVVSKRDCECACDEAAIKRIGEENRVEYGRTLISMVPRKDGRLFGVASTSMSSDGKALKERISLIAKKPKNAVLAVICSVLVLTAAAGCTFTSAKQDVPQAGGAEAEADRIPLTLSKHNETVFPVSAYAFPDGSGGYNVHIEIANNTYYDINAGLRSSFYLTGTDVPLYPNTENGTAAEAFLPSGERAEFDVPAEVYSVNEKTEDNKIIGAFVLEIQTVSLKTDGEEFDFAPYYEFEFTPCFLDGTADYSRLKYRAGDTLYSFDKTIPSENSERGYKNFRIDFVMTGEDYTLGLPEDENTVIGSYALRAYDEAGNLTGEQEIATGKTGLTGVYIDAGAESLEKLFAFNRGVTKCVIFSCPVMDGERYLVSFYGLTENGELFSYDIEGGEFPDSIYLGGCELLSSNITESETESENIFFEDISGDSRKFCCINYCSGSSDSISIIGFDDESRTVKNLYTAEGEQNSDVLEAAERAMLVKYKILSLSLDVPLESNVCLEESFRESGEGYYQVDTDIASDEDGLVEYILDSYVNLPLGYSSEEELRRRLFEEQSAGRDDGDPFMPYFKMIDGKLCYLSEYRGVPLRWTDQSVTVKLEEDLYEAFFVSFGIDYNTICGYRVKRCPDGKWRAEYEIEIK